jgi:hypothetical protein
LRELKASHLGLLTYKHKLNRLKLYQHSLLSLKLGVHRQLEEQEEECLKDHHLCNHEDHHLLLLLHLKVEACQVHQRLHKVEDSHHYLHKWVEVDLVHHHRLGEGGLAQRHQMGVEHLAQHHLPDVETHKHLQVEVPPLYKAAGNQLVVARLRSKRFL